MRIMFLLCIALLASSARSQIGGIDPRESIQKIVDSIAEEMKEIDRLLLQTKPTQPFLN